MNWSHEQAGAIANGKAFLSAESEHRVAPRTGR